MAERPTPQVRPAGDAPKTRTAMNRAAHLEEHAASGGRAENGRRLVGAAETTTSDAGAEEVPTAGSSPAPGVSLSVARRAALSYLASKREAALISYWDRPSFGCPFCLGRGGPCSFHSGGPVP